MTRLAVWIVGIGEGVGPSSDRWSCIEARGKVQDYRTTFLAIGQLTCDVAMISRVPGICSAHPLGFFIASPSLSPAFGEHYFFRPGDVL